jgi:hypothetical protein|tara:strand:+ start:545 stop:937 length:393 start_codon:yes stop_codon:yes gene_type:complete
MVSKRKSSSKIKKKEVKGRRKIFCPHCNSQDVKIDFSNSARIVWGLFNNSRKCNNCGYASSFFPKARIKDIPKVKKLKKGNKRPLMNPIINYTNRTKKWLKFLKILGWIFIAILILRFITLLLLVRNPPF